MKSMRLCVHGTNPRGGAYSNKEFDPIKRMNLGVLGFEPNDAGSNPAACRGEVAGGGV